MTITTELKPAAKRQRKMAREPKPQFAGQDGIVAAASTKRPSRADLVLGLLQRPDGATVAQLVAATGWLPHTTRAALTGLKKKGHAVTSEKQEGQGRVYRVVAA